MYKIYQNLLILSLILSISLCSIRPDRVTIQQIKTVYDKQWYSGYLDIAQSSSNVVYHMHYFFFPSQSNSSIDPILFWFNGGPGCSSLLGAMYQHGPFLINDAFASLMNNPYSWNKKANVIYLQSPAEVGFSYMDNKPENFTWTDDKVAELNKKAILEFFNVWTQYKRRQTYFAGESYAGIYVPTLFEKLHDYNEGWRGVPQQQINIKGFAVGNGCTDLTQCQFINDYSPYLMQLYRDYGFIDQYMYKEIQQKCANQGEQLPDDCVAIYNDALDMQDGINIYDAYRPCYQNTINMTSSQKKLSFREMKRLALRKRTKQNNDLSWAPPCVDSLGIDQILQKPQNRKILKIPDNVPAYSMCNADESFSYQRSSTGSYHIYKKLVPLNKYKIIKYSGDSDPAVPTSGTFFWINKLREQLKLSTKQYWKPWFTKSDDGPQNAGNVWELNNMFKLVTFKGIGHMAPQWNIQGGQKVIHNLMFGTDL